MIFCHWDIGVFVIVSYFVLRISNFLTKKTGFSFGHYFVPTMMPESVGPLKGSRSIWCNPAFFIIS